MNVFEFSFSCLDSIGYESVVQLLRILIEHIAISLNRRDSSNLVNVGQDCCQRLVDRTGLQILIKVTSDDDVGISIVSQYRPNEILVLG